MRRNDTYQNLPKYRIPDMPSAYTRKQSFPGEVFMPNQLLELPPQSPHGYNRKFSEGIYLEANQIDRLRAAQDAQQSPYDTDDEADDATANCDVPPPKPCSAPRGDSVYFDMHGGGAAGGRNHSTDALIPNQKRKVPHIVLSPTHEQSQDDLYIAPSSAGHRRLSQQPGYVNPTFIPDESSTDNDDIYSNLFEMRRHRKESFPGDIILPDKYAKTITPTQFTTGSQNY